MVGLILVTATTATVVAPPGPVAADQVSDLKAQATQIAKDLVLEQLQIDTYQQHDDVDIAKVQRDQAEIGSTENQIHADTSRISRDRKRLQDEVVSAYINSGSEFDGNPSLFEGNPNEAVVKAEYEEVASGDITLAIDALHIDENGLGSEQATLEHQEAQDQATTNQETMLTTAAHHTEVAARVQAVRGDGPARGGGGPTAGCTGRGRRGSGPGGTGRCEPNGGGRSSAPRLPPPPRRRRGAPPARRPANPSLPPFLQCVLQVESGGNYQAVSPGGTYMGGFQFSQATWNGAADLAGMPQLVNVPPNVASPADQDDLAIALYDADGEQPWNDSCRNS